MRKWRNGVARLHWKRRAGTGRIYSCADEFTTLRGSDDERQWRIETNCDLLRAAQLVCAAIPADGRARRELAQAGCALSPIRRGIAGARVLVAFQSDEPFGLAARGRPRHFLHHK